MFPAPRQGFTLLEVTVAIALFALAAAGLTSAIVNAAMNMERTVDYNQVERDLSFLRRYVLLAPDRETAEEGGDAETLHSGMGSWEVGIEETEVLDLFRVRLAFFLRGNEQNEAAAVEEELWLLRPNWTYPEERDLLLEDRRNALLDRRAGVEWLGRELEQ